MLYSGDKKALSILGAVVVAAIVVIAVATTLLVRGHEKPLPEVSFTAGDSLSRVEAPRWCTAKMDECRGAPMLTVGNPPRGVVYPLDIADHPVPVGTKAMLSVPKEVSSAPWSLVAQYATPNGTKRVQWLHLPDTKRTQILTSTPQRVLIGVEIQVISAVRATAPGQESTDNDDFLVQGIFAIQTKPEGFKIPNETELPDERADD